MKKVILWDMEAFYKRFFPTKALRHKGSQSGLKGLCASFVPLCLRGRRSVSSSCPKVWGKLYVIPLLLLFFSCQKEARNSSWVSTFQKVGSNSSPRLADLTNDGVLDIVLGAGYNEKQKTDFGVLALDGNDGSLLWHMDASDQMVGSAIFYDLTGDKIPEVFIGGRSANLVAINGATGELIWRYIIPDQPDPILQYARFNFYNPQLIPDQDGDGFKDVLISNGGNVTAPAFNEQFRFPGVLMILNSKSGAIIAADTMPDGKETYLSPLVCDYNQSGELSLFFGSGGETIGGGLFKARLSDLLNDNLETAKEIIRVEKSGFVAPPVLADLNGDAVLDLIANNHGGVTYAFDGQTDSLLWKVKIPGTESSSSLAVGFFNKDKIPDFFGNYSKGTWPKNVGNYQVLIDGKTGEIQYKDSLGCTGFFSPIAFDLDKDGFDEALLSVNSFDCSGISVADIQYHLEVFDFQDNKSHPFGEALNVKNVSSTPWLGDMDGDNRLDVVQCVQANAVTILEFFGMAVLRKDTAIFIDHPPAWGSYMGTDYTGIFDPQD